MKMNTLLEISYVVGPALFLMFGFAMYRRKGRRLAGLLSAMACVVLIWSFSVFKLASSYRLLDSAWYGQESELVGQFGQPTVRVNMPEGDQYIVYKIRLQPWRIVAVYNVYRGKVLSVTRPDDLSAALEVIKSRSEKESRFVKSNLDRMNQLGAAEKGQ